MLQVYARKAERFCLRPVSNAAIEQAISPALWYDLLDPSPQEVAEVEACQMEHAISDASFEKWGAFVRSLDL